MTESGTDKFPDTATIWNGGAVTQGVGMKSGGELVESLAEEQLVWPRKVQISNVATVQSSVFSPDR